jgi:hypothetical protein
MCGYHYTHDYTLKYATRSKFASSTYRYALGEEVAYIRDANEILFIHATEPLV